MRISRVDIFNFRRLRAVRLDLDETTVLVGANNTGKTAAVHALGLFLHQQRGPLRLMLSDIHTAGWSVLDELGAAWCTRADPDPDDHVAGTWTAELEQLHALLPAIDLYLDVDPDELHLVSHLIPSLEWEPPTPLRVRLQLELARDVSALQRFAATWRAAWEHAHLASAPPESPWPRSLSDYLSRELARRDNVGVGENQLGFALCIYAMGTIEEPDTPPVLEVRVPGESLPSSALERIVRVDLIAAQRGLGGEEHARSTNPARGAMATGLFTQQLLAHCTEQFKLPFHADDARAALERYAWEAERTLDDRIEDALRGTISRVEKLGYPGLRDPKIELKSRIRADQLLNHESGVQYRADAASGVALPEHAIGLGYQNLLMLSFQLALLRERREAAVLGDATGPARIHLVLIEEPEAHLHAQVQRAFVERARALLVKDGDATDGLATQVVFTSHASHVAHAVPFSQLRYFRRTEVPGTTAMGDTSVVNLTRIWSGAEDATRRFVERYLQLQHSDIFFAEAVILVEGTAERVLLPYFLDGHDTPEGGVRLRERYITVLAIGGAHAHRLEPLLTAIGLSTLVITDLDPLWPSGASAEDKAGGKPRPLLGTSQESSNATLGLWLPGTRSVDELLTADCDAKTAALGDWPDASVRVAYQAAPPGGGPCGSTFEDALILENQGWFESRGPDGPLAQAHGALRKVGKCLAEPTADQKHLALLRALSRGTLGKGELAIDILLSAEEHANPRLSIPHYIREGLDWLSRRLGAFEVVQPGEPSPTPVDAA